MVWMPFLAATVRSTSSNTDPLYILRSFSRLMTPFSSCKISNRLNHSNLDPKLRTSFNLAGCIWGLHVVFLDEAGQLAPVDAAFARLVERHQPREVRFVEMAVFVIDA
eukprot:TRINITY_DN358_c0_g1_i2.p1 TRINITY_DN358_c0_g1~~TRINITY_DN358_c0_g1_i2.p1  ORF type:complete len:108 (+),score=4.24 TRINITY_DN358_c0_g1_i2:379-702(+)